MRHDIFAESEWAPIFEKQAEERGRLKSAIHLTQAVSGADWVFRPTGLS
jgi:hypothetical protein